MSATDREELLRISVGSVHDWLRVKNNYNVHLLNALSDVLDAPDLHPERDALLAHVNHVRLSLSLLAVFRCLNPSSS